MQSRIPDRARTLFSANHLVAALTLGLTLIGVVLMARQYVANRSLWVDEALLAQNIVDRSFAELITHPLDNNQGAPIGFLLIEKTFIQVLGNSDYTLRLFPLLASIAALLLLYKVSKGFMGKTGLIALGLFCVSGAIIYYASEVKQYSTDVLVSLVLLLCFYECLKADTDSKDFIRLGFAGAIALWMSHPALFILVGVGVSLILRSWLSKDWRKLGWISAIMFIWLLVFAVEYMVVLRFLASNQILINYWRGHYVPMPPWGNLSWFAMTFTDMLQNPLGLSPVIGTAAILVGGFSLAVRRWPVALCFAVAFLALLAASGLQRYPVSGRLLLFAVPAFYLLVAEGVGCVRRVLSRVSASAGWLAAAFLVAMLLYAPGVSALQNFQNPSMMEDIKPVLSFLSQHKESGDLIYVYYGAMPAFTYYAPTYGITDKDSVVEGQSKRQQYEAYLQDIDRMTHHPRVWFVFSHNCGWCQVDEEAYFIEHLDQIGIQINHFPGVDADAYLYNLSAGIAPTRTPADAVGLYEPARGVFKLKNRNLDSNPGISLVFGPSGNAGLVPITGDWTGSGTTKVGLYDPVAGMFYLRATNTSGAPNLTFQFGPANSALIPIAGDWTGSGTTSVGLYDPIRSVFMLKNTLQSESVDSQFQFGPANSGFIPITGDWTGSGTTSVGLYDPIGSVFMLKNTLRSGPADATFQFGPARGGFIPITGDWDGNGTVTIGLYNPTQSVFILRNTNTRGGSDVSFEYGLGNSGWQPIVGHWTNRLVASSPLAGS